MGSWTSVRVALLGGRDGKVFDEPGMGFEMANVALRPGQKPTSPLVLSVRVGVVLLPVCLLLLATFWAGYRGRSSLLLWLGTAFQMLLSSLIFRSRQRWQEPLGTGVLILYLLALVWLWLGLGDISDGYLNFAQAMLLVVSLGIFASQVFTDSGVQEIQHACMLADRLASRKDWPADLESCRSLPDVKALRESLHVDATPAFNLLRHPRPQVRIAALAALEFRRDWRPGQSELVLEAAQRAEEVPVRVAAIGALANVEDRFLIERLAEFLRDRAPEVRRAATEALLWETQYRWPWIRLAIRNALSDVAQQDDGPLQHHGQLFSAEAISDLKAWVAEKGVLAMRAAITLTVHYGRALNESPDENLLKDLRHQLADPHAPAVIRIELAQLLHSNQLLDKELQEKLLDPMNPAPLRLIAAEALLSTGNHAGAITALRDVARMPNREIALATADVVQRRLGTDMGLALGQPLPQGNSRQAAEVTRRVMKWAHQGGDPTDNVTEPLHH